LSFSSDTFAIYPTLFLSELMLCWIESAVANISKKLLQQYERLRRHSEEKSYRAKWQRKMLEIYKRGRIGKRGKNVTQVTEFSFSKIF
jgi:hypothetical protein